MRRRFYIRPAAALLAALAGGIAAGACLPGYLLPALFAAGAAALWGIGDALRRRGARLSPLVLFAALGYLSLQPWVAPRLPADHILHFADRQPWRITGTVDRAPVNRGGRCRFILEARSLEKGARRVPVRGRLRVTVLSEDHGLRSGDRLALTGRIKAIRNFANPGGFDYRRYMAYRGVWASCYVQRGRLKVLAKADGGAELVDRLRRRIAGFIDDAPLVVGSPPVRAVLKALLVGDRQGISPRLRGGFNRAGAGHLLAISGLHVGIVAAAAFFFFRWLLSCIGFFVWRGWTAGAAALLTLLPVLAYGVLAGMSASTQRAVIMVTVFLAALVAGRRHDLMNTIAWAALVILALFPPALFSASFQLSFAAVFWIVFGLQQPVAKRALQRLRPHPVMRWLSSLVVVSMLAVLGTWPLVMFYFNQVSLVGPMVNVVLVPLMGFAAVPLGLGGIVLLPLTQTGAVVLLNLSAAAVAGGLVVIEAVARLPFAALTTVTPSALEIAGYYVLLGSAMALFLGERAPETADGKETPPTAAARRFAAALALGALLLLTADAAWWLYARFWHRDLRVTVLDVGQGSGALVELPRGRVMMVDGGGFSDNAGFDVGEKIVAPLLLRRKILTVDTLVLSHPNSDHLNGLLYIADHFHVRRILSNGQGQPTRGYARLLEIVARRGIRKPPLADIPRRQDINGAQLEILAPPADFMALRRTDHWRTVNNNALVVRIRLGRVSFLFPADIEHPMERELVARWGAALKSTVLAAPHHGSRTSSSMDFLEAVDPKVVVVSCGYANRFHFPNPRVMARYRRLGARVFTTARCGAVTLVTEGRRLSVAAVRESSCPPGALTN